MTRTIRILCVAAVTLLFGSAVATAAAPPSSEITVLKTLNNQLMHWFYSLSKSFDALADSEDQRALRIRLVDLNKAIYDLESDGRYKQRLQVPSALRVPAAGYVQR